MSAALGSLLPDAPADGVSNLRFSPTSDLLLASAWDGTVRLYDAAQQKLNGSYLYRSPVLDATFQDDSTIFSVGLDCKVKRYNFFARVEVEIGAHDKPIRCVEWLSQRGLVATGSWDGTLRLWDPRLRQGQNGVGYIVLPGKAFSMTQAGTRLVVATAARRVQIYDIRNLEGGRAEQGRESSLRFQTRCVRAFPNGTGYALSSVEGRVAMEYFDMSDASQAKKYAFKCHRQSEGGKDTVYPVNAMAFHPLYGTFATGGCDGVVNVWDGENKKRLSQIASYPSAVAALAFSRDGQQLAIAASYTYENGEQDHPADAIYTKAMTESEVRPKPRK